MPLSTSPPIPPRSGSRRSGSGGEDRRVRLVLGERRGIGDQALELAEGEMCDRLEELVVTPPDLASLLEEVMGGTAFALEQRLREREERRFAGIGRCPTARPRDLVEPKPSGSGGAGMLSHGVGVAAALGDR